MNNGNKRFDDYSQLSECLKCEHYYNNQCDGIKVVEDSGVNEPCTAYSPTRRVIVPEDIENLKSDVKRLFYYVLLTDLVLTAHLVLDIIFGG